MNLKPCPWCGKDAEIIENIGGWNVICNYAYCKVSPLRNEHPTLQQALEAWNRRADHIADATKMVPDTALLKLVADIRAAVGDPHGTLMQDDLVKRCRDLYAPHLERKREHLKRMREMTTETADTKPEGGE